MSHLDLVSDHSKEKLVEVPKDLLDMTNLKMLFLEGNFLAKLPDEIFWKLPKLMWLDMRNNLLESIPKSIANHQHLENLLLTNNNIEKLPNELGLVPKLKALQVAENPLIYPPKKVVIEGTKNIKDFLKSQFEIEQRNALMELDEAEDVNQGENEEIIRVYDNYTDDNETTKVIKYKNLIDSIKTRIADPLQLQPTLNVTRIQNPYGLQKKDEPVKIIHKVSRNGSKVSLKSCINKVVTQKPNPSVMDNSLKEGWLNQLRILLTDQERILQQERNLRALSEWRVKKKTETPKVFRDNRKSSPPYAVYEEYSKMPTREDLLKQLDNFFKDSGIVRAGTTIDRGVNFEKLVNDLMQQLREMEVMYDEARSPRSEIEQAGKQIKIVMDIQKKLLQLKADNDQCL